MKKALVVYRAFAELIPWNLLSFAHTHFSRGKGKCSLLIVFDYIDRKNQKDFLLFFNNFLIPHLALSCSQNATNQKLMSAQKNVRFHPALIIKMENP